MAFIRTIPPEAAEGPVRAMYKEAEAQFGYIPNYVQAFSLRPDVRESWNGLLAAVKKHLSVRDYELATLAAAKALRSSYCALAHGRVLAEKVFDPAAVTAIADDAQAAPLEPRERAMMAFAAKLVLRAHEIDRADIEQLRAHGYDDRQIFDLAATAAARCFFSKLLDALGAEPDGAFRQLDPALREALTVGRPLAPEAPRL